MRPMKMPCSRASGVNWLGLCRGHASQIRESAGVGRGEGGEESVTAQVPKESRRLSRRPLEARPDRRGRNRGRRCVADGGKQVRRGGGWPGVLEEIKRQRRKVFRCKAARTEAGRAYPVQSSRCS